MTQDLVIISLQIYLPQSLHTNYTPTIHRTTYSQETIHTTACQLLFIWLPLLWYPSSTPTHPHPCLIFAQAPKGNFLKISFMRFPSFSSSHTTYVHLSWSLAVLTLNYTFLRKRLRFWKQGTHLILFCIPHITKQYLFDYMLNNKWIKLFICLFA